VTGWEYHTLLDALAKVYVVSGVMETEMSAHVAAADVALSEERKENQS